MEQTLAKHQMENILAMLQEKEDFPQGEWGFTCLVGSGSDRRFFRICKKSDGPDQITSLFLAILPSFTNPRGLDEARSCYHIGLHLHALGVPVPKIYGYDEITGLIVLEDLGEKHFFDLMQDASVSRSEKMQYYRHAIEALAHFQIAGREGFVPGFCWDTVVYDKKVMLWESGYFENAFCRDYLGIENIDAAVDHEFQDLAARSCHVPDLYLMHRDFQSKNLMITEGKIRIIDFQGARFGPLAYDLASLLIDPYVVLDEDFQQELFWYYLDIVNTYDHVDQKQFTDGYYYLSLQRNLQILGAFAFLSKKKRKSAFSRYIEPALRSLGSHLHKPQGDSFPHLKKLLDLCRKSLDERNKVGINTKIP